MENIRKGKRLPCDGAPTNVHEELHNVITSPPPPKKNNIQTTVTDGLLPKKPSHLSKKHALKKEKLSLDRQIDSLKEERKSYLARKTHRCRENCPEDGA